MHSKKEKTNKANRIYIDIYYLRKRTIRIDLNKLPACQFRYGLTQSSVNFLVKYVNFQQTSNTEIQATLKIKKSE